MNGYSGVSGRRIVRYKDLHEMGVVNNRTQLVRIIDNENFPAGFMLSANTRAWFLDEVEAWLKCRPSAAADHQRGPERAARLKTRALAAEAA